MFSLRSFRLAAFAMVSAAGVASAQAGLTSNPVQTVTINATKPAALTVTINSGAAQTLATLTDNVANNFATPVNITTAWSVNPGLTASVSLVGYFSTPAQALANGTDFIPTTYMKGRIGAVGAFNAFTQNAVGTVGTAGGSLALFTTNITGANKNASRTDDLFLQIDLTGAPLATAGTYTGTLNLRAVTQ